MVVARAIELVVDARPVGAPPVRVRLETSGWRSRSSRIEQEVEGKSIDGKRKLDF